MIKKKGKFIVVPLSFVGVLVACLSFYSCNKKGPKAGEMTQEYAVTTLSSSNVELKIHILL